MRWIVLLVSISFVSCVTPVAVTPVTGEVSFADFSFAQPRDQVFDAALAVAQRLNLNVAVLEKSSGLLRFESAILSADQLDRYCIYPYKKQGSEDAFDTFSNWNGRSMSHGGGPVTGSVSLTVLLSQAPEGTRVNIRASFTALNARERYAVNSKQKLEAEFRDALEKQLGGSSSTSGR